MPENSTPATPETGQRVSVGEIAAFVAESNRLAHGACASVWDRALFFDWKADLFTRLSGGLPDPSAAAAAEEADRLRTLAIRDARRGVA